MMWSNQFCPAVVIQARPWLCCTLLLSLSTPNTHSGCILLLVSPSRLIYLVFPFCSQVHSFVFRHFSPSFFGWFSVRFSYLLWIHHPLFAIIWLYSISSFLFPLSHMVPMLAWNPLKHHIKIQMFLKCAWILNKVCLKPGDIFKNMIHFFVFL